MTEAENIREVEALGVDLMGFIFHEPSPRCCRSVPSYLPSACGRVGVFVDWSFEDIMDKVRSFGLDHVQLHGHESPDLCLGLKKEGLKVMKAFSVAGPDDIHAAERYSMCDLLVFDTKTGLAGGSGKTFDWSLLHAYAGDVPFLLSGGIGPGSAQDLRRFSHGKLAGYDLNSRFETAPGIKDAAKLHTFIDELKTLGYE